MKKRHATRILAALMMLAIASFGFSMVAVAEAPVKIVFWSHFGGEDGTYMDTMLQQFAAENPDIQVENLKVINEDYYTKLKAGITSGQGPDVCTGDADRLVEFKQGGLVQDMTPYAEAVGLDWNNYNQNIIANCTVDGEHLAIPLSSYASIMFVNKALLDQAGMLKLNDKGQVDVGSTPEDFLNFLSEYNSKKPDDVFSIVGSTNGDELTRFFLSFYGQTGGSILSDDMSKAAFNDDNGKKALTVLADMTAKGLWPKNVQDADQIFLAGKAAFYMSGVWYVGSMSQTDLDFIAQPIPQLFDKPAAWGGTHIFMMPTKPNQTDEQKKAVVKFADWMSSHALEWSKAGHVPSNNAVVNSEEFAQLPHRDTYKEVGGYIYSLPASPKVTAIVEVLYKYIPTAVSSDATVESVLATCESEINKIIAQ